MTNFQIHNAKRATRISTPPLRQEKADNLATRLDF
jgi:hypothetical protein